MKNMKNFKLSLILILSVTLFSCSKDKSNDVVVSPNVDLLATWSLSDFSGTFTGTATTPAGTANLTGTVEDSGSDYSITVIESPNEITDNGGYNEQTTLNIEGSMDPPIFIEDTDISLFETSTTTWTRSGNNIVISYASDTDDYTISITGNKMTLTETISNSEIVVSNELTVNIASGTNVYTFTKL
jgi:hypothetical protein